MGTSLQKYTEAIKSGTIRKNFPGPERFCSPPQLKVGKGSGHGLSAIGLANSMDCLIEFLSIIEAVQSKRTLRVHYLFAIIWYAIKLKEYWKHSPKSLDNSYTYIFYFFASVKVATVFSSWLLLDKLVMLSLQSVPWSIFNVEEILFSSIIIHCLHVATEYPHFLFILLSAICLLLKCTLLNQV